MIFMGDTHGLGPIFKLIDKNKIEGKNIIHVGDLGLGFQEVSRDVKNLLILDEMLLETNNTLYCIRGNHDNPMFWGIPQGLNLPKFHNVILVPDHTTRVIEGSLIYFAGGAISIDRTIRRDDKPPTWWKNEEYVDHTIIKDKDIDIVVTHTAPHMVQPISDNVPIVNDYHKIEIIHGKDLKAELKVERHKLTQLYEEILKNSTPKLWFYGHFHARYKTQVGDTQFIGLGIEELKEVE